MRIGLQTWGSEGDIRPFAALAGGLSAAGHEVTLAVTSVENKDYTALGKSMNFKIRHIGSLAFDQSMCLRIGRQVISERNALRQLKIVLNTLFDSLVEEIFAAAQRLCAENDMVIGHSLVYPLGIAAEKAQCPYVTVTLPVDSIPTKYRTPLGLPDLGTFMNALWWKLGGMVMNSLLKTPVNSMRKKEGLLPIKNIMGEVTESRLLNLIAISPSICQPQPDWGSHHHICGFFTIPDEGIPWQFPDDLKHFLHSGPPPVYVTFGSMWLLDPAPEQTIRMAVDAVRLAGCRAIIQFNNRIELAGSIEPADSTDHPGILEHPGDEILHGEKLRGNDKSYSDNNPYGSDKPYGISEHPDIYWISQAPHQYVFPHCTAIVHHGGAGTTQSATLHGCPSVVVEYLLDQASWGINLKRLGIAPRLLHRRSLTSTKLARQLRTVLDSPLMFEKARRLGKTMRGEDGVKHAVKLIENCYASYCGSYEERATFRDRTCGVYVSRKV
ncbi:MAG: glycosyltransferase [bacterium]